MGLLSKLTPRFFKKTVRKIGKAIKWATKPLRKALRKVLKPIGKVFSKLGWVGTLALSIWGGPIGAWFGSWLNGMAGAFMAAMPTGVQTFISTVAKGITKAAKFGKNVYSSITEVFKHGINKMGQAFGWADPGKLSLVRGEGLISGASISGAPVGTLTESLTKGFTDLRNKVFGKPVESEITELGDWRGDSLPKIETAITKPGAGGLTLDPRDRYEGMFADPADAPFGDTEFFSGKDPIGSTNYLKDTSQLLPAKPSKVSSLLDPIQPIEVTAKYRRPPGAKVTENEWFSLTQEQQKEQIRLSQRGPFEKTIDWVGEKIADTKASPTGRALEYGSGAYNVYNKYLKDSEYETPWTNEMTYHATSMLSGGTQQQTGLDTLFFTEQPMTSNMSPNQLAEAYLTGMGTVKSSGQYDPWTQAMQQPGYGYSFNDFLSEYYG
jgi:hypothetical protein